MIGDNTASTESRKPKLLVLTSTFPTKENIGDPRFVADLCHSLTTQFEICVLTQHRPQTPGFEQQNGIDIVRYRYAPQAFERLSENGGISNTLKKNPLLFAILPFFLIAQIFAITRLVKSFQPEVIHAHWIVPQGLCCALALMLIRKKPKFFITAHGGDVYGFKGALLKKLKKWVINRADVFAVVSEAMKKYVAKELSVESDAIPIMPMGADLNTVFIKNDSIEKNLGQLIFVGRLVEKKGLKYLIRALPALIDRNSKINLVVVGTGPELSNLKSDCHRLSIEDNVSFLGNRNHAEIAELLQQSETAVFPFTQATSGDMEGLGLVVIEAMGCMCPVIVGNVPAIHDTVNHKSTGYILDPADTELFVDTISRLHTDTDMREKIAIRGYQFARENFSWEKCADRYCLAFRKLLEK